MSKEIIKKYYDNFNKKNWKGMLEMLSPDVAHDISQGERQKGIEAFKKFLALMDKHYDEKLTDFVFLSNESGNRASAEFICNGTYKVTADGLPKAKGQKYKIQVGAFFEIKNGKITRISNHYNLNDWVSQVS